MFQLTKAENEILRSHFATLRHGEHSKYLPYAFTEHGVLMLSNVMKSARAIGVSIKIPEIIVYPEGIPMGKAVWYQVLKF